MRIRSIRGGILLDAVIAIVLLSLTAFALDRVGITLPVLVHALYQFLGR